MPAAYMHACMLGTDSGRAANYARGINATSPVAGRGGLPDLPGYGMALPYRERHRDLPHVPKAEGYTVVTVLTETKTRKCLPPPSSQPDSVLPCLSLGVRAVETHAVAAALGATLRPPCF